MTPSVSIVVWISDVVRNVVLRVQFCIFDYKVVALKIRLKFHYIWYLIHIRIHLRGRGAKFTPSDNDNKTRLNIFWMLASARPCKRDVANCHWEYFWSIENDNVVWKYFEVSLQHFEEKIYFYLFIAILRVKI